MKKLQAKNEIIINASVGKIWSIITDINLLHKVNPGVLSATGKMDKQGETRTCEIENKGKKGIMTEKLVELVPEKRTVWSLENDTLGMTKMLKEVQFVFHIEKNDDKTTRVTNETYYRPGNIIAAIMNGLMMKKMISKTQQQILVNLKKLAEN